MRFRQGKAGMPRSFYAVWFALGPVATSRWWLLLLPAVPFLYIAAYGYLCVAELSWGLRSRASRALARISRWVAP